MGTIYEVTQGDVPPYPLVATLNGRDNAIVDLSQFDRIHFRMRLQYAAASDPPAVDGVATIANAPGTDGQVQYDWQDGNLDGVGTYACEWVGWWSAPGADPPSLATFPCDFIVVLRPAIPAMPAP